MLNACLNFMINNDLFQKHVTMLSYIYFIILFKIEISLSLA